MMYDEMMAKKCHDMAYMIASEERLADPAEVEEVRTFECNEAEDAFRLKLDREHLEIQKAINNLLKLRGMGASPNNLARVKQ